MKDKGVNAKGATTSISITNDFMFGKVMEQPEIYRRVLELILDKPIEKVVYSNTQETMKAYIDSHGVRMDAYMQDDLAMYNTEMQVANLKELRYRSRYNGSMMDVNDLQPGKDYETIRNSYVIFICGFDPFGQGEYRYEFINKEIGSETLTLDEGTHKIFINIYGDRGNITPGLKELIDYIAGRKTSEECSLDLIKEIHGIIITANQDEKWRKECMKIQREMMAREARGRVEGEARGEARGIYVLIKNLCSVGIAIDVAIQKAAEDFGKSIQEVQAIMEEKKMG